MVPCLVSASTVNNLVFFCFKIFILFFYVLEFKKCSLFLHRNRVKKKYHLKFHTSLNHISYMFILSIDILYDMLIEIHARKRSWKGRNQLDLCNIWKLLSVRNWIHPLCQQPGRTCFEFPTSSSASLQNILFHHLFREIKSRYYFVIHVSNSSPFDIILKQRKGARQV